MQMKVISVAGDVLRLRTEGNINLGTTTEIQDPLASLLGDDVYSQKVLLALDQSDVIDSMGVAWLLKCHNRFRESGGRLVIHSIPPMINKVLRLMRLDEVIHLAGDEAAAESLALKERNDKR